MVERKAGGEVSPKYGPRYGSRVDVPQNAIAAALRSLGFTIQHLGKVRNGCPDMMVAKGGVNYLIEVKSPKETLSTAQREWHAKWRGQVVILESVLGAVAWANREAK